MSKLWLSLPESELNLSFKLEFVILTPSHLKKNKSRSNKMRRAEFRKRRRSNASVDVDEEQEEEDERTPFFFPQFDCFVCNALVLGQFLFLCFIHFFVWLLKSENEGKFVSLIGLDAMKTNAKKGKNEGGTQYPHMLLPKSFCRHSKQIQAQI